MLEELKSAAAAVQARAAAVFDASQRRAQSRAGVPAGQLGRGVGAQIALARRDSPHRGSRHLGFGKALVHEMPHTLNALSAGVLSEWRATLMVRETACLDVEDRRRVDELICSDPSTLEGVGDRKLIARIRSITQAIDPASQVRRNSEAVSNRYVSCRPAPDTMSYLTGLLPVAQGVAVYAALSRAADSLRATGDERGRGQIMADTLVERVTGQATADRVPVEVQLVITDRTLFFPELLAEVPGACAPAVSWDVPAYFPGYGTVSGAWARGLLRLALGTGDDDHTDSSAVEPAAGQPSGPGCPSRPPDPGCPSRPPDAGRPGSPPGAGHRDAPPLADRPASAPDSGLPDSPPGAGSQDSSPDAGSGPRTGPHMQQASLVTLRRLYVDPVSGDLTAMESKARAFPAGLARMIHTRDQTCRTPWCDAPIRHIDHIQPHAAGGPTSYTNGQGLCEACNLAKEAPGWTAVASASAGSAGAGTASEAHNRAGAALPSVRSAARVEKTEPLGHTRQPDTNRRSSPGMPARPRHTVRITTPTGHVYTSRAPALPGPPLQQETGHHAGA
ncbi:HNH endonuclease [Arthrobacter koreensis]|uniref:HNH endonuclease n=1 Tax=Arthrobacter koreensis TaxID=199136 RepID=UPI002DC03EFB|nr:DUF222 domain-containing protein [Arthrobacter koreensis]